jgi:hypothetical protein
VERKTLVSLKKERVREKDKVISYESREIKLKSNFKKGLKTRYKDNLDREKANTNVVF